MNILKKIWIYLIYWLILLPIFWLFYNAIWDIESRWLLLTISQIKNTLLLIITVTPISLFLWFLIAYYLTLYKIPFRKVIKYWYILSLILPAYIIALLYSDITYFVFWLKWLIFILILSTLPFSVISFRNAIKSQSQIYLSISQNLNISKYKYFFNIFIPILKPSIIFITFVIIAEIISEFGATYFLWNSTIMTWIYDTWFVWYKTNVAAQVSLFFYSIFIILLYFFKFKNIYNNPVNNINIIKKEIRFKYLISFLLFLPIILTFIIPIIIVLKWTYLSMNYFNIDWYFQSLNSTIIISFIVWTISVIISIFLSYIKNNTIFKILINIIYSIPWIILSIWILTITPFITWFFLNYITFIYWLVLKFLSLSYMTISNHINKINENLLLISRNLKKTTIWHFFNVDLPIINKSIILSFILIFIEIVKELPITLTLAPFWYKSLSMNIFFAINSERLYQTWPYILTIFIICLLLNIIMLNILWKIKK